MVLGPKQNQTAHPWEHARQNTGHLLVLLSFLSSFQTLKTHFFLRKSMPLYFLSLECEEMDENMVKRNSYLISSKNICLLCAVRLTGLLST